MLTPGGEGDAAPKGDDSLQSGFCSLLKNEPHSVMETLIDAKKMRINYKRFSLLFSDVGGFSRRRYQILKTKHTETFTTTTTVAVQKKI